MKINYKIVAGLLAAGWTYDMVVGTINAKRFAKMKDKQRRTQELANLYARKLNEHHIPLDEFETIVMNALIED